MPNFSAPPTGWRFETCTGEAVFKGLLTALITPFKNGRFDAAGLQKLIEWQIGEGCHGLVAATVTGECATLSQREYEEVLQVCVDTAKKRVPLIASGGSNSTAEAIHLSRIAREAGADAVLHVLPYYNKPMQEGLYQHIKAITDDVDLPLLVYNIPGRTAVDLATATIERLRDLKRVVGIVDGTGNLARPGHVRRTLGHRFIQLCGDDALAVPFIAQGGNGCLSAVANVAPHLCSQIQTLCLRGAFHEAEALQDRLQPLIEALAIESNPAPLKYAASLLGLCSAEMRLPMVPISESSMRIVDAALQKVGLLRR